MQDCSVKFVKRDKILKIATKGWRGASFSPKTMFFKNLGWTLIIKQISDFGIIKLVLLTGQPFVLCL